MNLFGTLDLRSFPLKYTPQIRMLYKSLQADVAELVDALP